MRSTVNARSTSISPTVNLSPKRASLRKRLAYAAGGAKERDEENDGTPLPVVAKADELLCENGEVVERQTQPPRHFTDATLLSAMTGIARFVQDKDLKKSSARPMA